MHQGTFISVTNKLSDSISVKQMMFNSGAALCLLLFAYELALCTAHTAMETVWNNLWQLFPAIHTGVVTSAWFNLF